MSAASPPAPDRASTLKALNVVLVIAVLDALLLVVLLYVAQIDRNEDAISILGPIHGLGFVLLLFFTFKGAGEGRWSWWFPIATLVTGGPLGSIVGDIVIRRRLKREAAA